MQIMVMRILVDVSVSVPSTLSVAENNGVAEVCATLVTTPTEATTGFIVLITLSTTDDTGTKLILTISGKF